MASTRALMPVDPGYPAPATIARPRQGIGDPGRCRTGSRVIWMNALANLDEIVVGIAHVAANLAAMVLWLREESGAFAFPLLIAFPDIGDPDIQEAGYLIQVFGRMKNTVGLSSVGPPPTLTISQLLAI